MPHRNLLYGEDYCRHTILVHEGPLDVWAVGPGATATCGTEFSPAQIRRIARYPRRGICFDSEPAAQTRARRLAAQLSLFPGETDLIKLDANDPGSAGAKELAELRGYLEGV
jgi:hypothetical protein